MGDSMNNDEFDDEFLQWHEWLAIQLCAVFNISYQELGLTEVGSTAIVINADEMKQIEKTGFIEITGEE